MNRGPAFNCHWRFARAGIFLIITAFCTAVTQSEEKNSSATACSTIKSFSSREDCLQDAIVSHMGSDILYQCPNAARILADCQCSGHPLIECPSHGNNSRQHCGKAEAACASANLIHWWVKERNFYMSMYGHLTPAFFFLLGLNVLLQRSTDKQNTDLPLWLQDRRYREFFRIVAILLLLNAANILISIAGAIMTICEAELAVVAHVMIFSPLYFWTVFHLILTYASPPLCQSRGKDTSWRSYFLPEKVHSKSQYFGMVVKAFLVFIIVTAILHDILFVGFPRSFKVDRENFYCRLGEKRWTVFGWLQYTKVVLEFVAASVYASGPLLQKPGLRLARRIALLLLAVSSIAVFIWQFFVPIHPSMLIYTLLDEDLAGIATELAHALYVSILGLLEPRTAGESHIMRRVLGLTSKCFSR